MGTNYVYLKLAGAISIVLCAMYALWRWADREKQNSVTLDERLGWALVQAMALTVSFTFIGLFLLALAMLEGFKIGMV